MGRSPCCDNNGHKKGPWSAEEDATLANYVQLHGPGNWKNLPKIAGLQRCGKSCRLRWTNYLRPDIKRGKFSFDEEETIIQLHSVLGNKWSTIAARLPGRTDNEIKNYWNTHIRKRFLRNGIDPVTHAPRLDLLNLSPLLSSPQLSLSNLICLNQALLNPEVLRLALNLGSLYNDLNSDILLQKLQGNYQVAPSVVQPNQFENNTIINQQTPITQNSNHESIEGQIGQYNTNSSGQIFKHEYFAPDTTTSRECIPAIIPNYSHGISAEGESFYSNLQTFEVPEGLDLENFM